MYSRQQMREDKYKHLYLIRVVEPKTEKCTNILLLSAAAMDKKFFVSYFMDTVLIQ